MNYRLNPTYHMGQSYPMPALVPVNYGYCDIREQLKHAAASTGYDLYISKYDQTGQKACSYHFNKLKK